MLASDWSSDVSRELEIISVNINPVETTIRIMIGSSFTADELVKS